LIEFKTEGLLHILSGLSTIDWLLRMGSADSLEEGCVITNKEQSSLQKINDNSFSESRSRFANRLQ